MRTLMYCFCFVKFFLHVEIVFFMCRLVIPIKKKKVFAGEGRDFPFGFMQLDQLAKAQVENLLCGFGQAMNPAVKQNHSNFPEFYKLIFNFGIKAIIAYIAF